MPEVNSLTLSGGGVNEDLVRIQENAAIVLDGATGLTERSITDASSDGRWYVETLADDLSDRLDSSRALSEIASAAITNVAEEYHEHPGSEAVEPHEVPSAAGVLLRWDRSNVEYLVLGDCSVVFETADGVESVLGEGPRELDQKVIDEMKTLRAESAEPIEYESLRDKVHPMIVEHRKLKNTQGGYWTFGLDPNAVDHADTGSVPVGQVEYVYAFTDGFEPVCATYDAFTDWSTLGRYLRTDGADRATNILRAFEATDPQCRTYPRLKPSDDVGIATIDFAPE